MNTSRFHGIFIVEAIVVRVVQVIIVIVSVPQDIDNLVIEGNKSRSHAVFIVNAIGHRWIIPVVLYGSSLLLCSLPQDIDNLMSEGNQSQ